MLLRTIWVKRNAGRGTSTKIFSYLITITRLWWIFLYYH
nr:MAG TPA: hypothetical protein [Caudoviricetes sp.]